MPVIQGNQTTFFTYDYLKVNETAIALPEQIGDGEASGRDPLLGIDAFQGLDYGVNRESLAMNKSQGNYYAYYEAKVGERRDFGMVEPGKTLSGDHCLDTHDIVAEEGSHLRLVLHYHGQGDQERFRNSIIRIWARQDSRVEVFIVQRDSLATTILENVLVVTEDRAAACVHQYELGGAKLYTNYHSYIYGEGSHADVDSIYFGRASQQLDMLYNIFHYGKESTSNVVVHGVMKDQCHKVLKSNLDFKHGATQAEGSEEEYVTLLNDGLTNLSVPMLLCNEEDVRGNHAASAGKVDPNILFYIMSRGFDEVDALRLVVESTFSPTVDALGDDALEALIWTSIEDILKGEVRSC